MLDALKKNKFGWAGVGLVLLGLVGAVYSLVPRSHSVPSVPLSQLGLDRDHGAKARVVSQGLPTFRIVGADGARAVQDNASKNVRLWDAMIKVRGSHLPNVPQQVGDCVSFGAAHAIDYLQAVQIVKQPGSFEFKEAYPPYIYGVSRVLVGRKHGSVFRGDGSVGAYAAEGLRDYGCLRADADKVPPYSGSVARSWGASGPPQWAVDESKPFAIQTFAQVTTAAEARDAICNGYPVTIASGWWGTTKIDVVDGRRVATRNTAWGHQQCLIGYDGSGSEPYFYCLNSWGDKAHPAPLQGEPPGGYWIRFKDVDHICGEQDSFALSGFEGFPAAEINWDNLLTRQSLVGQVDTPVNGPGDGPNWFVVALCLAVAVGGAVLFARSKLLKLAIEPVFGWLISIRVWSVVLMLGLFWSDAGIAGEPNFERASVRSQPVWEKASVRSSECPWERAACRPAAVVVTPVPVEAVIPDAPRPAAMVLVPDEKPARAEAHATSETHATGDRRQDAAATKRDYSAYMPWYVDGHPTDDLHLMLKHHVGADELVGLTQDQKDRLHGMLHGEKPKPALASSNPAVMTPAITVGSPVVWTPQPVRASSACPGGVCPTQYTFQVFGRRRR